MAHPLTDQSDEAQGTAGPDQAESFVHRLTDLLVEEVSAVDRAANRRTIVVRKRDNGGTMLGQAIHDGAEPTRDIDPTWTVDVTKETPPEAQGGPQDGDKAQGQGEGRDGADGGQGGQDKAVWTDAYINDLPDSAFLYVAPGGEKDADGMTTPRSLRYFPVRDDKGELDLPHVRNALSRIPQADIPQEAKDAAKAEAEKYLEELTAEAQEGEEAANGQDGQDKAVDTPDGQEAGDTGSEGQDGQDAAGAGDVAKALAPVLKAMGAEPEDKARDLLWMAMDEIGRGALRSDEDKAAVSGLLDALRGAVMKAEAPEAQDADSGSTGADKATAEVMEAVKLLQVALGRMVAGESLDAEAHEAVARAHEILSASTSSDEPAAEGDGQDQAEMADREETAKAGAKMSAANRRKFRDALDKLVELFHGVLPESERKGWPKPTAKAAEPAEDRTELTKAEDRVKTLEDELAVAKAEVKDVNVRLAKAMDRAVDSNVVPTEKRTGEGDVFSWGFDLNDPDD